MGERDEEKTGESSRLTVSHPKRIGLNAQKGKPPLLQETIVKEITDAPFPSTEPTYFQSFQSRCLTELGPVAEEFRSSAIELLLKEVSDAAANGRQLVLIAGSSSEYTIVQWLIESIRNSEAKIGERSGITTVVIRAFEGEATALQTSNLIQSIAFKGDIVLFCPSCCETDELSEGAVGLREKGVSTYALGAADMALPLEQYVGASIPVGRSQLSEVKRESRLFLLFSFLALVLKELLEKQVPIVSNIPRPKGFFSARGGFRDKGAKEFEGN